MTQPKYMNSHFPSTDSSSRVQSFSFKLHFAFLARLLTVVSDLRRQDLAGHSCRHRIYIYICICIQASLHKPILEPPFNPALRRSVRKLLNLIASQYLFKIETVFSLSLVYIQTYLGQLNHKNAARSHRACITAELARENLTFSLRTRFSSSFDTTQYPSLAVDRLFSRVFVMRVHNTPLC